MRDLVASVFLLPIFAAVTAADVSTWERLFEKWGIGLVGLGLFVALAKITTVRENKLQADRDAREAASTAERVALLTKNNELNEKLLNAVNSHAKIAEQLSRDSIKASNDHASALRMLIRKMKRPCVAPIDMEGEPE